MRKRYCIFKKVLYVLNSLALVLVAQMANATCFCIFHQPEFPEEAKKFSKVK